MVYYKEVKRRIVSINWDNTWEEEEVFLNKLIKERSQKGSSGLYDSLYQYKAQTFNENFKSIFILQVVSFFSFLFLLIKSLLKTVSFESKANVAYFYNLSIFSMHHKEDKVFKFISSNDVALKLEDIIIIFHVLLRTSFNFTIISSYIFRVSQIRYAIEKYNVSEVWSNMEYSCSCGLVYEYCKARGIVFKNFMHGEKLLTLRDSFNRFDEFYVWSNDYKNFFKILNCKANIVIDNPWELKCKKINKRKTNQVCYFLKGIETKEEMKLITKSLEALAFNGMKVFFKPHPRQRNMHKLFGNFNEYKNFENNDISSLYQFDYVIAQYSTVLFQCYCNNQEIVLDDVSNKELFKKLSERRYVFSKVHENKIYKLSELLCRKP